MILRKVIDKSQKDKTEFLLYKGNVCSYNGIEVRLWRKNMEQ